MDLGSGRRIPAVERRIQHAARRRISAAGQRRISRAGQRWIRFAAERRLPAACGRVYRAAVRGVAEHLELDAASAAELASAELSDAVQWIWPLPDQRRLRLTGAAAGDGYPPSFAPLRAARARRGVVRRGPSRARGYAIADQAGILAEITSLHGPVSPFAFCQRRR
jgi:hypothetical protein